MKDKNKGQIPKHSTSFSEEVKLFFQKGRNFEKIVQQDFIRNTEGLEMKKEVDVLYLGENKRRRGKFGRMDMFLEDDEGDYVVIYEIKATNWDNIKPKNRTRNLYRHGRQLHKYIESYLHGKNITVVHGVIYPKPPVTPGLKEFIEETALVRYGFPIYWYSEISSKAE